MSEQFQHGPSCQTVTALLGRIGDKWSMLVINYLGNQPMRFSELRRVVNGISQKMLTTTLRSLERDGFISRHAFPTIPPRVEYRLTELGHDLRGPVQALAQWAVQNELRIADARRLFDERHGAELLDAAE